MQLVHKSVDVPSAVWKRLRLNAELSDTSLRAYLCWLILQSDPVTPNDLEEHTRLREVEQQVQQGTDPLTLQL